MRKGIKAVVLRRPFLLAGGENVAGGIYLDIDASELDAQIDRLKSALTPARVNQVMYGIFQRTGGHVRKILKEDLP